jgi:hypothetical protein
MTHDELVARLETLDRTESANGAEYGHRWCMSGVWERKEGLRSERPDPD